jgi:hypothetical protein
MVCSLLPGISRVPNRMFFKSCISQEMALQKPKRDTYILLYMLVAPSDNPRYIRLEFQTVKELNLTTLAV